MIPGITKNCPPENKKNTKKLFKNIVKLDWSIGSETLIPEVIGVKIDKPITNNEIKNINNNFDLFVFSYMFRSNTKIKNPDKM